jgi:hypothetical protein
MKKQYLPIIFLLLTVNIWAQAPYKNLAPGKITSQELWKMKADRLPALSGTSRNIYEMYVDYSVSASDDIAYYSPFSSNYTSIDTSLNYSAVVIKNLVGYTDANNPLLTYIDWSLLGLTDSFPDNVAITIDTVYFFLIHQNNTGHLDTLVMNLVKTHNGAPNTNPGAVLKSIRDSVDFGYSVLSGDSWINGASVLLGYEFAYTLNPGQKAAFAFYYYNWDKRDTCAILGGCVDTNMDSIADHASPFNTSYMRLPPFIGSVTPNRNIIYVDAQENNLGAFNQQNWLYFFKISINTVIGIADNFDNLKVTCVSPNPATDRTTILYGLNQLATVTINLYDLSGKMLHQVYSGIDGVGSYMRNIDLSDMANGTYLVSVQAGNGTPVISKLIIYR